MPAYRYQVKTTSGQVQAGVVTADSLPTAAAILRNQGQHIVMLSPVAAAFDKAGFVAKFQELN